jgi:acyl-CoA dehydrogenase
MKETISNEQQEFLAQVKRFVERDLNPIFLQVETTGEIPEAIVDKMRALGLFGLSIPKQYGGLGLSTLDEIMVYEELTRANACFRSRIGTSNSIGSMGILFDGTDDQKQRYLPRIASGRCRQHQDHGRAGWRSLDLERHETIHHQRGLRSSFYGHCGNR